VSRTKKKNKCQSLTCSAPRKESSNVVFDHIYLPDLQIIFVHLYFWVDQVFLAWENIFFGGRKTYLDLRQIY